MERRFLLAVSLMIAVLVVPSFFLKRLAPRPTAADSTATAVAAESLAHRSADSVGVERPPAATAPVATARPRAAAPTTVPTVAPSAARDSAAPADTASVAAPAMYRFTSDGAMLEQATFPSYRTFHPGDDRAPAQLLRPGGRMLAHRLVAGSDTVRLDQAAYQITRQGDGIELQGGIGSYTQTMHVTPAPGEPYVLDVSGEIGGLEGRGALLVIGLGDGFANVEADSMDNYRFYAVAVRRSSVSNTNFRSVDSGTVDTLSGPFDWVAVKSKYFIGALLSADSTRPQFGGALLVGEPKEGRSVTRMPTWVTMPVTADGRFHYQLYLGPQSHRTLHPLGRDLDRASPYGWIFKPIVMPVASWITGLFIWAHQHLSLSYGLVLIVFGVLVRVLLWPLNQKAMKSQVAMMAVQPILKDLQTRYKNDPQKLQQEMMKVYKEHQVNPLGGCLPMLLPMPILLALFFVFSHAIELRGTSFLWLPDLALRDPLYITPLVMGGSMFLLSKLSQAGMPPNPQAKMMTVVMPIMMTFLFLNFASGLNLYYAVSNVVSLPQQYLINRARREEMARRQVLASTKKG